MKKGMLITLPKFDDVTEYLYTFSKPILAECKSRGVKLKIIEKEDVIKSSVESAIKSYDYNFVLFNGHGSMNMVCGHKNECLIKNGENEDILNGRVVYARACWASLELGPSCVKRSKDCCFIGYDLEFGFLYDETWIANPSKDNIARVFFETSNRVALGLIKGQTAKEANENSKRAMLKEIKKLLLNPSKDYQAMAQALWDNYSGQTILGNKDYRI